VTVLRTNHPRVPPVKVRTGKLNAHRTRYRKVSRIEGRNMTTARDSVRMKRSAIVPQLNIESILIFSLSI
jgi:DNA-binding protein